MATVINEIMGASRLRPRGSFFTDIPTPHLKEAWVRVMLTGLQVAEEVCGLLRNTPDWSYGIRPDACSLDKA